MRFPLMSVFCLPVILSVCADMTVERGFGGWNENMNTVDNLGHAVLLYRMGEFDLVGMRVPLYAYWTSASVPQPSLLGYGWRIPWLECRMMPMDAQTYELWGVNGERLRFFKDKIVKNLYRTRHGQCAVVCKQVIKVYNSEKVASEPDMVFRAGHLTQFRYRSKRVRIDYDCGLFARMSVDGHHVIFVEKVPWKQGTCRLVFNVEGSQAEFSRAAVEVCMGSRGTKPNMLRRETLTSLKNGFGEDYEFTYGLTKAGMARVSDGHHSVSWNPTTRLICTFDDWFYNITEVDSVCGIYGNARYYRRRKNGETEAYHMNWKTGIRICDQLGCRVTSRLFTSGKLRGLLRWQEKHTPEGFGERTEFAYNENGILVYFKTIREKDKAYNETWNDEAGRIARFRVNGDDRTACEYIGTPNGERVVARADGMILHRGVPNAEEFVQWHEDTKRGLKISAPKTPAMPPLAVLDVSKGVLAR